MDGTKQTTDDKPVSHFLFTLEILATIGEEQGTVKMNVLSKSEYPYVRNVDIKRACDSGMIQFMKSLPKEQVTNTTIQKTIVLAISFMGVMTDEQFSEVDPLVAPTKEDLEQGASNG